MFKTALLATTALVVGVSFATAGGLKTSKGVQVQRPHKNIVATVNRNGIASQGMITKVQKGAHVQNKLPVFTPGTYSNLSKDANAQFVSWYGFYAENSCYSYYGSSNYHYVSCFDENSAVPVTGVGNAVKHISVPVYGSGTLDAGLYNDNAGSPGSLIHSGSVTPVSTSYCCSQLQTASIHKTTLTAGTKYWVEVTAQSGSFGLWETEDTDYSTGQPYDWQYGYSTVGNFGTGTHTYSYHSGWIASTASPYRPALSL